MIHQDGIFDDPKGKKLRNEAYSRMRYIFRFKNALLLFADVHDQCPYVLTVSSVIDRPQISMIANLFDPATYLGENDRFISAAIAAAERSLKK